MIASADLPRVLPWSPWSSYFPARVPPTTISNKVDGVNSWWAKILNVASPLVAKSYALRLIDHYEQSTFELRGARRRKQRFQPVISVSIAILDRFLTVQSNFRNRFAYFLFIFGIALLNFELLPASFCVVVHETKRITLLKER